MYLAREIIQMQTTRAYSIHTIILTARETGEKPGHKGRGNPKAEQTNNNDSLSHFAVNVFVAVHSNKIIH